MSPILRNIPIFGPDRYSFMDVVKHYNDMKVGYDGAILRYGRVGYKIFLPENDGGNVPIRHQLRVEEISDEFGLGEVENTAIGFEFELPLKKGFKTNVFVELLPWDLSKRRLAHVELRNVYFKSIDDHSDHNFFIEPENDDYAYFSVVLNKETDADLTTPNTFLQNKILDQVKDRSEVINRLFILRVKQIVWDAQYELEDIVSKFEVRHDSIIIEVDPNND
ncbi:MAG: hypothetical protein KTR30_37905 [Saprospiraceae bacterium]|nr:hypothetical protein [Saprospiraceae bacterium]